MIDAYAGFGIGGGRVPGSATKLAENSNKSNSSSGMSRSKRLNGTSAVSSASKML
jgi:hypothetical protein